MNQQYAVYILRCRDQSLYTGITGVDLKSYTYARRPLQLVYAVHFSEVLDAIAFEKQLKRWSKKKKEALINGNQEELERYARSMYRKRIDFLVADFYKLLRSVMVSSTNHDTAECVALRRAQGDTFKSPLHTIAP
jgi:putative endonuclease